MHAAAGGLPNLTDGAGRRMNDQTSDWLRPMIEAAGDGIDIGALMVQSSMPVAEAASPLLDELSQLDPNMVPIDWIRFGELLRHELGWDDTYPAYPDEDKADRA